MREQLQAFINAFRLRLKSAEIADVACVIDKFDLAYLDSILATEPPAVSVKAGWVAKDYFGVHWFEKPPVWIGEWQQGEQIGEWAQSVSDIGGAITDPWETSHPNGGPECIMEIKP